MTRLWFRSRCQRVCVSRPCVIPKTASAQRIGLHGARKHGVRLNNLKVLNTSPTYLRFGKFYRSGFALLILPVCFSPPTGLSLDSFFPLFSFQCFRSELSILHKLVTNSIEKTHFNLVFHAQQLPLLSSQPARDWVLISYVMRFFRFVCRFAGPNGGKTTGLGKSHFN